MSKFPNPSAQHCAICEHASKGATEWPCRCCIHINSLEDYFEPASDNDDEIPSRGDAIRSLGNIGLAEFVLDLLHVECGNCPAEPICISGNGPRIFPRTKACKSVLAKWLSEKETGKGGES